MTSQSLQAEVLEASLIETVGAGNGLIIAVLGPMVQGTSDDLGSMKRVQIRDELRDDGHRPFFPEQCIKADPTAPRILERERVLLSSPLVDLVIILHTDPGAGTLQEIANFEPFPEIVGKSRVLFPSKFLDPGINSFSDTVSAFLLNFAYSEHHLQICNVVWQCRKWASVRSKELWSLMESHSV